MRSMQARSAAVSPREWNSGAGEPERNLRVSASPCLRVTPFLTPRPDSTVFDPEAQTRRELVAGRVSASPRRNPPSPRSAVFDPEAQTRRELAARPREGFTLLEVLVAVSIIALLMGILIPVVRQAQLRARIGQMRTDIQGIDSGLSEFKSVHGWFPPSAITLYEEADDWAMDSRSRSLILQNWPQFDFTIDRDLDRDGNPGETFNLTGAECLVFFLGGLHEDPGPMATTLPAPNGFAKNPADPFAEGGAREAPYFEFKTLSDVDGDGFPEYLGPYSGQTAPIIYLSSYNGTAYRAADLVVYGNADDLDDIYYQADGMSPQKASTFQIIFPGFDNLYGIGGTYDPANPGNLDPADYDNITNFSNGQLIQ